MTVTPEDMDKLREQFMELALENVELLREVLKGKKRVNLQQVTLLKMLYAKVLPDISSKQVNVFKQREQILNLSRSDLESLVLATISPKPRLKNSSVSAIPTVPAAKILQAGDDD